MLLSNMSIHASEKFVSHRAASQSGFELALATGVAGAACAAGEEVRSLAGGGRSPERTILHGQSLLTGKLTGNFAESGPI